MNVDFQFIFSFFITSLNLNVLHPITCNPFDVPTTIICIHPLGSNPYLILLTYILNHVNILNISFPPTQVSEENSSRTRIYGHRILQIYRGFRSNAHILSVRLTNGLNNSNINHCILSTTHTKKVLAFVVHLSVHRRDYIRL